MHVTCHVWQCAPPASEPWQKRKQNKFFFASVLRVLNVMCATGMEHLEHSECFMPGISRNVEVRFFYLRVGTTWLS